MIRSNNGRNLVGCESGTCDADAALTDDLWQGELSKQVASHGIRVNSVAPGFTETKAAERLIERLAAQAGTDTSAARHGLMIVSKATICS